MDFGKIQALNRVMFEQDDVEPFGEESSDEEDFVLSESEVESEEDGLDDDNDDYNLANDADVEVEVEERRQL